MPTLRICSPERPWPPGLSDCWDSKEQEEPEEGSANPPPAPNLPGKLVRREGPGRDRGGRRGGRSCIQPRWLPSQLSFASSSSSSCMSQAFPRDLEQPRAARAPGAVAAAAAAATALGAPEPGPPPRRAPASRARTDHGEGGPGRRRWRGQQ